MRLPQTVDKLSRTRKSINIFDKAQTLKVKKINHAVLSKYSMVVRFLRKETLTYPRTPTSSFSQNLAQFSAVCQRVEGFVYTLGHLQF